MYDMSRFDYNIEDVSRILKLRVVHKNSVSLDVDCPFCGKKGKLNINKQKNVFRCNYCAESGGMLTLYASLYNVSKAEAHQQIRDALGCGIYRSDYAKAIDKTEEEIINSDLASVHCIDHTYSEMLKMLVLNEKHKQDLLNRGLTERQVEEQRYKSVPLFGLKRLSNTLANNGCTLKGVPGFYKDKDDCWTVNFKSKNSGILIPIVSHEGYTQGFQIRLDHATNDKKYIWLSSVNYQEGVSSGSPVHVVGDLDADTMYITEGALKGTIAHYLSGYTFICVAGVNAYKNLPPILKALQQNKLHKIYQAYDMDKLLCVDCDHHYKKCNSCDMKNHENTICPYKEQKRQMIQRGCSNLLNICTTLTLSHAPIVWNTNDNGDWDGSIKGIDDYYYNIKQNKNGIQ